MVSESAAHAGPLVRLIVSPDRAAILRAESRDLPSWDLTPRQLCDIELLLNGGFSPLTGFLTRADYERVCRDMRLTSGVLWPMPITLDVPDVFAQTLRRGSRVALRDPEGVVLAVLDVEDVWQPDKLREAHDVFGTASPEHPGVRHLLRDAHPWYVGGRLHGVMLPTHYDFHDLRLTPAELRGRFRRHGWTKVAAFQTRNPMHRAHQELTLRAALEVGANLLIHPVVGMTKPGDVDHYTRVRCYHALITHYPKESAALALLPLAMRMGGPREAVWHAIIRRNYGCTHLIVGRDHAGPGSDSTGVPFYGPYDAQQLLQQVGDEIGVHVVPFREMRFVPSLDKYLPEDEIPAGTVTAGISGTELRARLAEGRDIPEWFTFPDVAAELRRSYPPRAEQGCTVFFTGLSGSGKSTIANVLLVKLLERGGRRVTLLDGDLVRKHLSSELGFSKEHRDLNIRRIGFVAAEITRHGGFAICAPIAPYDAGRMAVRQMVEETGGFVLVHVATPLETCESRDRKGLYAKARAGIVKEFTGISDPYESPTDAELVIDTTDGTAEEAANRILLHLERAGFVEA